MLSVNIYTNMLPQKNNGIPGNNFYCIKQRPQRLNLFPTDPNFWGNRLAVIHFLVETYFLNNLHSGCEYSSNYLVDNSGRCF